MYILSGDDNAIKLNTTTETVLGPQFMMTSSTVMYMHQNLDSNAQKTQLINTLKCS